MTVLEAQRAISARIKDQSHLRDKPNWDKRE
jgi:hypothetical protein